MGKTADGAVWLDETMLSPFDYFQYFRNTHDADVGKFLKLFTDLDLSEIAELEKHIHKLYEKVSRYERLLQELQVQLRQKDQSIREILKELDNKVSHER